MPCTSTRRDCLVGPSCRVRNSCVGVLLVFKTGGARSGAAQLLIEQLERAGARILGAVLNTGPRKVWPYYSRYNDLLRFYDVKV